MTVQEKMRWKEWADTLRQSMMEHLKPHVTKSVAEITAETGTEKPMSVVATRRFWTAIQAGKGKNDTLKNAGFEVEFTSNAKGKVDTVTLHLNDTWAAIMQNVLDRRRLLKQYQTENGLPDTGVGASGSGNGEGR